MRPLPSFPVIRDLVVDMTQFFKQYHSIKPYLINDEPVPEKERLQSPADRNHWTVCTSASVCVLHHPVPFVLVEPRQVRRAGRPVAGISIYY